MVEEQRLTAAELLQYFLSRYRVDEVAAEAGSGLPDTAPIAAPLAAAAGEDEPQPDED